MIKKIIFTIVALLVTALAAVKLFSNQQTVQEKVYRPDADKKVLVKAQTVEPKDLNRVFTYTGTFRPFREVMLTPQVEGKVTALYFEDGSVIPEGKLLVQIDDELLRAQYISAEASYETAKRNFERYEKASESEGVSKMQYDSYWQQYKNAESQLKQLDKNIRLNKIVAPFAGTITQKDVEIGSVVNKNNAVGRLTDLSQLKLEISVPEKEIYLFHEGENASIQTEIYPGQNLTGKIDYVSDRADDSHNYTVKILIKNTKATELKAGMYGTAVIGKDLQTSTLVIPRSALLGSAKNPQVFVVQNDTATLRDIQTGSSNGLEIEVIKGLKQGEVVVFSGQINLSNGSPVTIAQ
ncbi:MAG TPA: efflux RND transporter periplasmic adaptor subunit [Ohtaekwangia sp.]|uniref:efflux RND transporter periplasmic adaptor subunit n=1 Tax=Ohtaekwangia sp. TaxID=2066019 RepID=UPI002F93492B